MRPLHVIGILLALALIGGSLLLQQRSAQQPVSAAPEERAEQPGYSARDAEIVETGPDGLPRYRLHAARIEQMPRDARITLADIRMTFRAETGTDWTLTARRGRMPEDARRIELDGSVVASGQLPRSRETARLVTEQLAFDTEAELLVTRAPVAIDWSGQRLVSLGAVADLRTHRLSLESKVHGHFTP
ncbi:MAG: LPS export ABC transporter periplasmic protein LptC [Gammaproteobacteria bacterium]|nr:LPS export ABC transporter periplasmic protein LptC [Gammaproteobacteria bacterium]